MKKMNKKGFTLSELLAVIVILAIIMVIAVPQILEVINDSRTSAWKDNLGMIEKSIELNASLIDPTTGSNKINLSTICPSSTATSVNLSAYVDIDSNQSITCKQESGSYVFTVSGGSAGQFNGKTGTITCSSSNSCTSADTTASN